MHAELYTDGGCRPTNPGHAAFGAVLTLETGQVINTARYLGWRTNNYAEYAGIIVGMKVALDNDVSEIDIFTDSQLLRGQLAQNWRCNVEALKILNQDALALLAVFKRWEIHWIKRDLNTAADALCTEVILAIQSQNPWRRKLAGKAIVP